MSTEVTIIDPKDFGLKEENTKGIAEAFQPKITERDALAKVYNEVIQMELNAESAESARELRLKLVKVRTGIRDVHKTQKAFFLASGKYVDAWKNKETLPVEQMEERLKEIEEHEKRKIAEAKEKLSKERSQKLEKYVNDISRFDLGDMDEDVFDALFQAKKKSYDDRIAQEEKERLEAQEKEKAEKLHRERKNVLIPFWNFLSEKQQSLNFSELSVDEFDSLLVKATQRKEAEEKRQERIKKQMEVAKKKTERLKKQAEAKELRRSSRAKELQPYIVFIRDYNALIDATEKDYKAQFEEIKKGAEDHWEFERQEKARKQKEENDRLAEKKRISDELQKKKEAEEKQRKEAEEKRQSELQKGDSEKLNDLISDLQSLKTKYTFKSEKNIKAYSETGILIDKVINHINK